MIQQGSMIEIPCHCLENQLEQVSSICTRPRCNANSACCQKCIPKLHDRECLEHMISLELLQMRVFTLQNLEIAFDSLVSNLNQVFKQIKNAMDAILKPIKDYQSQPNLKNLNLLGYLIKMKPSNSIDQLINQSQKVISEELSNLLKNITLIQGKSKQPSINEYTDAENLFQESEMLFKSQNYEEAYCQIEKATELVSNNELYQYQKGLCLYWLDRQQDAIDQFNLSISIKPTVKAYYSKANSLTKLRQFDEAKNCCEQGLAQFPNDKDLTYQIGFYLPKGFQKK